MISTPEKKMNKGLEKAIKQYEYATKMALKHDNYPEQGPFLVEKNIDPLAFEAWSLNQLQKWKIFYDKNKKEIWLYGDPTLPHARTASWLSTEILKVLERLGGEAAGDAVNPDGDALRYLPAGRKEPDLSFTAESATNGPSVVGEIAYGNESLIKLKEEQKMWCESPHTQFFIGIKIIDNQPHHHEDPKCVLTTWDRDNKKLKQIDFGYRTSCNCRDKSFLKIPIKHLFHGTSIPASLVNHTDVKIDLFKLREKIIGAVKSHRGIS